MKPRRSVRLAASFVLHRLQEITISRRYRLVECCAAVDKRLGPDLFSSADRRL